MIAIDNDDDTYKVYSPKKLVGLPGLNITPGKVGAWKAYPMQMRDMAPAMTGEDFSWFLHQRPGAFVWIGNGPAEPGRELHNDGYDYNDAILPNAAGFLAGIAKRALRA